MVAAVNAPPRDSWARNWQIQMVAAVSRLCELPTGQDRNDHFTDTVVPLIDQAVANWGSAAAPPSDDRLRAAAARMLYAADRGILSFADTEAVRIALAAPGKAEPAPSDDRLRELREWVRDQIAVWAGRRDRENADPEARTVYTVRADELTGVMWRIDRLLAAPDHVRDATKMVEPSLDLAAHLRRQSEWSRRTFGPGKRTNGVVDHIRKELDEVMESGELAEWIDVAILAFDGAWRSGATPEQIVEALVAKQAKNEARKWPDWRTADPDKAIEHDRSGEPAPQAPAAEPRRYRLRIDRHEFLIAHGVKVTIEDAIKMAGHDPATHDLFERGEAGKPDENCGDYKWHELNVYDESRSYFTAPRVINASATQAPAAPAPGGGP